MEIKENIGKMKAWQLSLLLDAGSIARRILQPENRKKYHVEDANPRKKAAEELVELSDQAIKMLNGMIKKNDLDQEIEIPRFMEKEAA